MTPLSTLKDLYVLTLCRVNRAEKHSLEVLPKLIAGAAHRDLTQHLMTERDTAKRHADRLAGIFERLGLEPSLATGDQEPLWFCLRECSDIATSEAAPDVRDSAIIAAWRQYLCSIGASYESIRNWSKLLGDQQAYGDFQETIDEKDDALKTLNKLAESINQEAMAAPV